MDLSLKICRDVWGGWNVHGLAPLPVAHLPSYLQWHHDYARKECAAAPATIELLTDGFYVVIHQERGWPRRIVGPEIDGLYRRLLRELISAARRYGAGFLLG